jgi:SAM-dependent methyltransferase
LNTHSKSYQHQINHLKNYPEDRCKFMLNHNTINRWRYERFYNLLDPLIQLYPDSKWLTVGDFYYGTDAQYLKSKGLIVTASDIDDHFLKIGKEIGYIDSFSKQNVESLTFEDESFDFVLCKESFHHLPRPYVGLYEMLRVSKTGVILLEPYDRDINVSVSMRISNWLLKKIKGSTNNMYEISGNFKYSISKPEIEKIALGLNLPLVAFKYLNDYYKDGLGMETKSMNDKLIRKVKRQIIFRDILYKLKIFAPTFLFTIIFKEYIDTKFLKQNNFELIMLPRNPYLK